MLQIYKILGLEQLNRILLDTALAKNKRQVHYTSLPHLELRKLFDIYYTNRSLLWGGAYPRPSVEILDKAWKLKQEMIDEGERGVEIDLDMDVDYSTYP